MSSFVAHSIIGLSTSRISPQKPSLTWTAWLIFLANSPDIDYIFLWLFNISTKYRITHSIGFVSILPLLTLAFFKFKKDPNWKIKSLLAFAVSYSHLLLDLFVAVYPKPYLWPFYSETLNPPFGILPSAGKLALQNIYLYKNLLIELGILLPTITIIYLIINRHKGPSGPSRVIPNGETKKFWLKQSISLLILIPFLSWGLSLYRG